MSQPSNSPKLKYTDPKGIRAIGTALLVAARQRWDTAEPGETAFAEMAVRLAVMCPSAAVPRGDARFFFVALSGKIGGWARLGSNQ